MLLPPAAAAPYTGGGGSKRLRALIAIRLKAVAGWGQAGWFEALARRALAHPSSVFRLAVLRSLAAPPPSAASESVAEGEGLGGGGGGGGGDWGVSEDLVLGPVLEAVDDLLRPAGGVPTGGACEGPAVGRRPVNAPLSHLRLALSRSRSHPPSLFVRVGVRACGRWRYLPPLT